MMTAPHKHCCGYYYYYCFCMTGARLAQLWGCPFVEASAKEREKVDEVFIEIVREMNSQPVHKYRRCCTLL